MRGREEKRGSKVVGGGQKPKHRARPVSRPSGTKYGIALGVTTHPKGGAILFQVVLLSQSRADWLGAATGTATFLFCRPPVREERAVQQSVPRIQAPLGWLDARLSATMQARPPEAHSRDDEIWREFTVLHCISSRRDCRC